MHPVLLHIGHMYLPTFGLLAALGIGCAMVLSLRTARLAEISPDELWNAGTIAVLAAFVTSRLLLVLENLRNFRAAPILLLTVPSLTAGGLLLTTIATMLFLTWRRVPVLRAMDAWAPAGLLLWAFLAAGHLAEGSDPGLPWRRGLRTSAAGYREQPVALYAVAAGLSLCGVMYLVLRHRRLRAGRVAGLGLLGAGIVQFFLTFARLPYTYPGRTPWALLDPLQWVGLGMAVAGGLLFAGADVLPLWSRSPERSNAREGEL